MNEYDIVALRQWAIRLSVDCAGTVAGDVSAEDIERWASRFMRFAETGSFEPADANSTEPKAW